MPKLLRAVLAIVLGFVAGSAVNMGLIKLSPVIIPPPHLNAQSHRTVTVNVNLHALPAYRALGFSEAGEEVRVHGLAFVPMRWGQLQNAA